VQFSQEAIPDDTLYTCTTIQLDLGPVSEEVSHSAQ